jgi:hypothetical protein
MTVICDYLDVTLPPDSLQVDAVLPLFDDLLGSWRVDGPLMVFSASKSAASCKFTQGRRFQRLSFSGRLLEHFRAAGRFLDVLALLSDHPHNVTRADFALDVAASGADVLPGLFARDRGGYAFGRKAVPVERREREGLDGRLSGSVIYGDRRKHQASAIVYDKQLEAYEKRGEALPPTVRYELRLAREVGVSLRDVSDPAPCFYSFMSPDFVPRPPDVGVWERVGEPWRAGVVPERLPAARMLSVIDSCADLDTVARLAAEIGPEGLPFALSAIRKRLERGGGVGADGGAAERTPATPTPAVLH